MAQPHSSTPAERAQWVSQMIINAHRYGFITSLSRQAQASRQTLYTWLAHGRHALEQAFTPRPASRPPDAALERAILTLLVDGHASYRGIQRCLHRLGWPTVSLGTISAIVTEAGRRAQAWFAQQPAPLVPTLLLDELYGNDRHGAYLSVVDPHSLVVWATAGPLPVDAESWTLLLWEAQEHGLRWHDTMSDGGAALSAAVRGLRPQQEPGRDVWHVLHRWGQVQARVQRRLTELVAQAPTVARQAARVAAGQRPLGRTPQSDVTAHAHQVAQMQTLLEQLRYLGAELRALLEVVVLRQERVLDRTGRGAEVATVLALLAEVAHHAPSAWQGAVAALHAHVAAAVPGLLVFTAALEPVEQEVRGVLGAAALGLLGWAWQRRRTLGWDGAAIVAGLPAAWRTAARWVLTSWAGAVRASSGVETWHSVLRPHVAVHRVVSPGLVALLAVWHNHRVFARGARAGQSPLQCSGHLAAPLDWLVALGYPAAASLSRPHEDGPTALAWAA